VIFCITACANRQSKTEQKNSLSTEQKSLIALGQLWGFLKYHHPEVAQGNYDWDMELIKMIPLVREAESELHWKKILDDWLNNISAVTENPNKKLPNLEIKIEPNYGEIFNMDFFLTETIEKIKHILNNAIISKNHYVNVDMNRSGQLFITNEAAYEEILYPDLSYRLLALFRFWNIVNYFYPYKELCDQDWNEVLVEMLPFFVDAENREQYILSCLRLAAKLDDSHAGLYSDDEILFEWQGKLKTPFEVQFIEDELVVTLYTRNDIYVMEKIEIGDIIMTVDGVSIVDIMKKLTPYTPASNVAVKQRELAQNILRGNTDTVTLILKGKAEVKIPRYDIGQLTIPNYYIPHSEKEGYSVLDSNIGYVLPSNCKEEERSYGFHKVLDGTKGLIVDMRCYPKDRVSMLLANVHLKQDKFTPTLRAISNVAYPGYFFIDEYSFNNVTPRNPYTQKIIVIVNEYTQSWAEEQVMIFQLASNVSIIGSKTAAALGRVVFFDLPGKIHTRMTGIYVSYPDGSNLQRVGIKIDEIVKPTIAGIKTGRDELLERAVEIINDN